MPEILIEDLAHDRGLVLNINGRTPNFTLRTEAIPHAAMHELEPAARDFLEIAAAVFYADGQFGRGGPMRSGMGRDWRRNFRITMNVRRLDLWQRPDVIEALTETIRFLTEDQVEFRFARWTEWERLESFLDLDPAGNALAANEVILLSGGLDSFAGALEALNTGSGKVLLVSHRSAPKVHHRQDELASWLIERFPERVRHIGVSALRTGSEPRETTQRSRSLLFTAIGHAVAQAFGGKRLSFYENGVVSHNLPISPQVVGTMATRTTHPQSITLLNRLLALISPDGTKVSNPYQWMTKTEVIERIAQFSGQDMIAKAVSCTHVREQTAAKTHCGRCSQCLDRRFAILAAGLEAHDPEDFYSTDVLLGIRADDQYKTLAVEWTRHAIDLREIDDKAFLGKFGTETSRVLQGHTPSPKEEIFGLMIGMHRRHGVAVHKVMMQAVALQQAALVDHQLQPSCLLRLWISDPGSNVADLPSIQHPQAVVATEAIGETEVILDPAGPWTARFSLIGSKPVVVVDGLARVSGAPAQVAHQLKEFWFDDVANGRTPKDHHFVLLYTLPKAAPTKETAKQSVRRCRKALSDAYELVFGYKPAQPLLIESGGKLGYRIDPLTKVIDFTNPR